MKFLALAAALPFALATSACATAADTPAAPTAAAKLAAGDGAARGTASVTQAADGLHVLVKAIGVTPGIHAVHIHTTGQ